jgi:hypothetical protein
LAHRLWLGLDAVPAGTGASPNERARAAIALDAYRDHDDTAEQFTEAGVLDDV